MSLYSVHILCMQGPCRRPKRQRLRYYDNNNSNNNYYKNNDSNNNL